MAQLKFYKLSVEQMASRTVAAGAIWFNKDQKTIEVYNGSQWEKYAGSLQDATWSSDVLTITKYDGSKLELDFKDVASTSGVQAALNTLKSDLLGVNTDTADKNTIYGAKAAAAAAQSTADSASSAASAAQSTANSAVSAAETNASNLSVEVNRAKAAEDKIEASIGLAQDGSHVTTSGHYTSGATTIVGEISALDAKLKEVSDSVSGIAGGSLTEINGKISSLEAKDTTHEERMKAIEDEIDAMDASFNIDKTHIDVVLTQVDGKITEFTVSESDIASAQTLTDYMTSNDAALAGVKTTAEAAVPTATFNAYKTSNDNEVSRVADIVDTFFKDAGMDSDDVNAYKDTLKELQTYIAEDTAAASTMAANIQSNREAIGVKASGDVQASGLYKEIADGDAAVSREVGELATRVQTLENSTEVDDLSGRVDTAESEIDEIQSTISGYSSNATIKSDVDVVRGAAATAQSTAEAAQSTANAKVASVTGDNYITASGTTEISLTVNVSDLAEDATGLAKAADVYNALSWVEFE